MSMCTEIHGSAVSVHYAIPTGFVAQVLTLKPGTKPPDQPSVGNQMFAVTSATGSESRQWLKSSGLLTIRPGRVPSLSAYAYQSSVSLLLARLPTHYTATAEPPALTPLQRIERADRFFAATGADIRHGGDRAFYAEGPDYVQMPPFETFHDAESHAATLAHEITHWTKHGKRLARDFGHVRFGDEGYAKEEL
ncbi:MAG TPA: zincin-like metallopeptidase domain-containing protein, partial [Xanthobacteraceae bacterium]|nr:zincin-like metallopeptidase domain-containing protein [Xanthobacteraceae bacterium]